MKLDKYKIRVKILKKEMFHKENAAQELGEEMIQCEKNINKYVIE